MKRFRVIAVLAMAVCVIVGTMSAFAYEHKVTVSAGNGNLSTDLGSGTAASIDVENAKVTVGGKTATITAPDTKHVVTGFKIAGHDTSEVVTSIDINDSTRDRKSVV